MGNNDRGVDRKKHRLLIGVSVLTVLIVILSTIGIKFFVDATSLKDSNDSEGTQTAKSVQQQLIDQASEEQIEPDEANLIIDQADDVDAIATSVGITLDQSVLDDRAAAMYQKEWGELNGWQRIKVRVGSLIDLAYSTEQGGSNVYIFNVPFSENYGMYTGNKLQTPDVIEKARIAAENKAKQVKAEVTANPANASAIAKSLRNTKPFSTGYGYTLNMSKQAYMTSLGEIYDNGGGDEYAQNFDEQGVNIIKNLSPGGVSDVTVEVANLTSQESDPSNPYYEKDIPVAYRVFYVKDKVPAQPGIYDKVKSQLARANES